MPLHVATNTVAGRPVLLLSGRVDLATVPALQNALSTALVDHRGQVVAVDLDAVEALDDVALGVLLGAAGRARRDGGDLVVVTGAESLRARLTITGFDRAITVAASISALT